MLFAVGLLAACRGGPEEPCVLQVHCRIPCLALPEYAPTLVELPGSPESRHFLRNNLAYPYHQPGKFTKKLGSEILEDV